MSSSWASWCGKFWQLPHMIALSTSHAHWPKVARDAEMNGLDMFRGLPFCKNRNKNKIVVNFRDWGWVIWKQIMQKDLHDVFVVLKPFYLLFRKYVRGGRCVTWRSLKIDGVLRRAQYGSSHHWVTVYRILNWRTSNIRSFNDSKWLRMTWDKNNWLKVT